MRRLFAFLSTISILAAMAACTLEANQQTIKVESVSINQTDMSLEEGESTTLTATVLPENAENKLVRWNSSDESIVLVSSSGKAIAMAIGKAVITAQAGEVKDFITITVVAKAIPVTGISLEPIGLTIQVGETKTITPEITPQNATNKNISWASSNSEVATVEEGSVTGIKQGSAIITATTEDGGKTASCFITVADDIFDIKIDGKFDDWKSADIPTAELGDIDYAYPNLLVLKSCGDKDNVYFYFEVKIDEAQEWASFSLYVDSDNNPFSGGVSWLWSRDGAGFEYLIESEDGFLANNTTYAVMNDIKCYKNLGPDRVEVWGDGWLGWDANVASSFDKNAGVVKDGVAYFELAIPRVIINAKKTGAIVNVGAVTYKQRTWYESIVDGFDNGWWDWPNGGALPASEDGVGTAEMLRVKLP